MNQKQIVQEAKKQLAVDLNCKPENFDPPGKLYCPAADLPGRRLVSAPGSGFRYGHLWNRYSRQCIRFLAASIAARS